MTDERERLAVLVHELRSPVAALRALADGISTATAPDDRRRLVALAIAGGRDIDRLLSDPEILSLRREPVDIGPLAHGLETSRVSVEVRGNLWIDGDPVRLRQLLANVVGNGLRHGERVRLEALGTGTGVVVQVTDDGPGVEAGIDPFARGVSGAGSSGYGLWLARAIAEAHGGTLDLVPREAAGACFRLALPRASGSA